MILRPCVIALTTTQMVNAALVGYGSWFALRVLRHWNLSNSDDSQIEMERRTYLISSLLTIVFWLEFASLVLLVLNADHMAPLFVGAMCAVGVFNTNAFGFPALYLKLALFFGSALWLTLHYLDNRSPYYPLLKIKFGLLLLLFPAFLLEAFLMLEHFVKMQPDVITSCCGSLFGDSGSRFNATLTSLSLSRGMVLFGICSLAVLVSGLLRLRGKKAGQLFPLAVLVGFAGSILAIISFISLYVYEHPNHHCPFCMLQGNYHYIGYLLYLPLFAATATGLSSGVAGAVRHRQGLQKIAPLWDRIYTRASLGFYLFFIAVTTMVVVRSHLILVAGDRYAFIRSLLG